jgi:kynureninase
LADRWAEYAQRAEELDAADVLAPFREQFYVQPGQVYLDGNSLGLLSRDAEQGVLRVLAAWREMGIEGWTQGETPWFTLAEELGAQTAALVGAEADEVIVTNSTTVNLHQLLATLYQPSESRPVILTDSLNFPSDAYAIRSHLSQRGMDPRDCFRIVASRDGRTIDEADIVAEMTGDVQMAVLPVVQYRSGQLLDMQRIAAAARKRGILLGLDCSHSIGAVSHSLDAWGVDFAFWCGYKYLNGGPGSAGGLYLNRRHFGRAPGLAGWFGSRKEVQFDMAAELEPAEGAGALQIGTPNLLSMAPLIGTLPMLLEAGIDRLRAKSLALTNLLMDLADQEIAVYGFEVVNPREAARRGGHVALAHAEAPRICKALRAEGVIPDFRPPDIVRLAPVPLYTRFVDCVQAVRTLAGIMETGKYEQYPVGREMVS